MLNRTHTIEKVYFSISEVAEMFDVNTSLLRFWEKEFPQLQPRKNSRGNRIYSKKDIDLFHQIHDLVKVKGYTLDGAKNVLKTKDADHNQAVILSRLQDIRKRLVQLQADFK
jgi:DNA-binding transcriptional MerR regulator